MRLALATVALVGCLDYGALGRPHDGALDQAPVDQAAAIDGGSSVLDLSAPAPDLSIPDLTMPGPDFGGVYCGAAFTPSCTGSTAALCEDFENGPYPGWTPASDANSGIPNVDTLPSPVCRGNHALHAQTTVGGSSVFTEIKNSVPALSFATGGVHMRFYVLVSGSPTTAWLAEIFGTKSVSLALNADFIEVVVAGTVTISTTKLAAAAWHCVELEATSSAAQIYLDDNLILSQPLTSMGSTPQIHLGIVYTQQIMEAYFDEVVIDSKHVGCAR